MSRGPHAVGQNVEGRSVRTDRSVWRRPCKRRCMLSTVLLVGACAAGLLCLACLWVRRRVAVLEALDPPPPSRWPKVSIVVPARNEALHLERAVESRLAEGYPNVEMVIVDDRSDDDTGGIIDRLASRDPRITPHHIERLPEGWLGKVYAMHRGVAASTGEWILLSDADVHVRPGTLAKVIAFAEAEGLDHVAALPTVWPKGFLFDAVIASFVRLLTSASLTTPLGCGAFNLVRRSAYDATPGFEALRMEVGDDVELARMLTRCGGRSAWLNGRGALSLEFYPSLAEMARSMEKTAGVLGGHPLPFMIGALLFAFVEWAPLMAAVGSDLPLVGCGLTIFLLGVSVVMNRWMGQPGLPALFSPVASSIGAAFLVRAALLAMIRGGIRWRGTFYPLGALRSARENATSVTSRQTTGP